MGIIIFLPYFTANFLAKGSILIPTRALTTVVLVLILKVRDRTVVKTVDHARRCTSPEGVQVEIDRLMGQTPKYEPLYGRQVQKMWCGCMLKLKVK